MSWCMNVSCASGFTNAYCDLGLPCVSMDVVIVLDIAVLMLMGSLVWWLKERIKKEHHALE